MRMRVATAEDLAVLLPARVPRRVYQAYMVQLRRSVAFTVLDGNGVAMVGGLFPVPDDCEREAWMFIRKAPRVGAKTALTGAAIVLEHAGDGWPIVCHVAADRPQDLRFAEFLGFVTFHEVPETMLMPRSIKLGRPAIL